jgi:hypothetical protein
MLRLATETQQVGAKTLEALDEQGGSFLACLLSVGGVGLFLFIFYKIKKNGIFLSPLVGIRLTLLLALRATAAGGARNGRYQLEPARGRERTLADGQVLRLVPVSMLSQIQL